MAYSRCLHPGCGERIDGGARKGRCARHVRDLDASRNRTASKRDRVIARARGICQVGLAGCTVLATTVDHKVPRAKGGSDAFNNLQAACSFCNSSKRDRG
jgi:5-methylcytosine-specific restriction endonuclease McrA